MNRSSSNVGFRSVAIGSAALLAGWCVSMLAQETPAGFHAYAVRNAAPDEVAARLRKMLGDMSSTAKVLVDQQSKQVLVQGNETTQQLVAQMILTLDQPAPADAPERAPQATAVRGYRIDGDLPTAAKRLQERFPANSSVRIAVDDRTKQLVVVAPAEVQAEIAKAIQSGKVAGVKPAAPAPRAAAPGNPLVHALQHITWRDLESELKRLWGEQLTFSVAPNAEVASVSVTGAGTALPFMQIDRRNSQVAFTGASRGLSPWRSVVAALDAPRDRAESQTQLVSFRNADPNVVRSTVSLLQADDDDNGQVTAAIPLAPANRAVATNFQQPANAAAANAPAQPAPANPAAPAQPAPAAVPGEAPADGGAEGGLIGPVQIEFLDGLDVMILRGNKRDVARVQKIIEDIERLSAVTQPVVEVLHLKHVNGDALTTLVTELYTEILSPRQGQVSIRALGDPNAILLIGRAESIAVVRSLIEKLDQPSPPASKFEVFKLKFVSAADAELTVRNFFVDRPGFNTNPRTGLGARVQVSSDFRTNSLIVQASPRDLDEVKRLIASIDVEESGTSAELRIFKLKNATAENLATVLQSAISNQQQTTTGQQQGGQGQQGQAQGGTASATTARLPAASLEFMMVDQNGGKLLRSGILSDVLVTADAANNSLVVRAPAKSMELIAALIEQLDKLPDASAQLKVFTIINGDATNLTTVLQSIFGQTVTAGQNTAQNTLFGGLNQLANTGTTGGSTSIVPLRFAVDQRTNSILASGTESDLQVVETILLRLDENVTDRKLSVVRLRNTQAASVATAIQDYLTRQLQNQQTFLLNAGTTRQISSVELLNRYVYITPEAITNSLIISATPQYYDEIMEVIRDLDVRPPMVMVQVLIAEVTLNDTMEIGTEFGLQDSLVFDRGKATPITNAATPSTPGFGFNGSPLPGFPNINSFGQETLAGQSLSNFATGRANSALGYSGLVLSAANESINILFRALQDKGRLQILSRPQVMTMHNQPAYVQVGADIARITGTNVTTGVVTQNVQDVQTGLILSILPLINDDGVIVMGIEAERSALGADADGTVISGGAAGAAPIVIRPINRTKASTTISARDGQTVVFAGLIQKTNQLTLRRIPFLSEVPLLGRLFKYENNFERRTELLIVMTPHLIRDEGDAERIKMEETERMSWCLSDVINVTGDWGLQGGHCAFCESEAPTIFPDIDPTGSGIQPDSVTPSGPTPAKPTGYSPKGGPSSSRRSSLQPTPEENDGETIVTPPEPMIDAAAHREPPQSVGHPTRSTSVTYGPLPASPTKPTPSPVVGVSPAAYQPPQGAMRLPATK